LQLWLKEFSLETR